MKTIIYPAPILPTDLLTKDVDNLGSRRTKLPSIPTVSRPTRLVQTHLDGPTLATEQKVIACRMPDGRSAEYRDLQSLDITLVTPADRA